MSPRALWILAVLSSACATTPAPNPTLPRNPRAQGSVPLPVGLELANHLEAARRNLHWEAGEALAQGFFGAAVLDELQVQDGSGPTVDGADDGIAQYPWIGGGMQWKLGGTDIDIGLEGMFGIGWRSGDWAFASGSGGAVLIVDVDLLLIDVWGGPFISVFLGDNFRAYAAAGPVMQWVDYQQDGPDRDGIDDSGTGFGTGGYARVGLEVLVSADTLLGFGVRWSETTVDLGAGLGDFEQYGYQFALTVTQGF